MIGLIKDTKPQVITYGQNFQRELGFSHCSAASFQFLTILIEMKPCASYCFACCCTVKPFILPPCCQNVCLRFLFLLLNSCIDGQSIDCPPLHVLTLRAGDCGLDPPSPFCYLWEESLPPAKWAGKSPSL